MTDQPVQFHETFAELTAGLPPSQLREAHKRLSKCKTPLTDEEIAGEHPRVQACLERIAAAYARKKVRSKASSKARREAARERIEADRDAETVIAVADETPTLYPRFEACTIEAVSDLGPTAEAEPVPVSDLGPTRADSEAAPAPEPAPAPAPEPAPAPAPEPAPAPAPAQPQSATEATKLRRLVRSTKKVAVSVSGNSLVRPR